MDKQRLQDEFDGFFEFCTTDRSVVTAVSALLFAEHIARPIEAQVEQLQAELAALRVALKPSSELEVPQLPVPVKPVFSIQATYRHTGKMKPRKLKVEGTEDE